MSSASEERQNVTFSWALAKLTAFKDHLPYAFIEHESKEPRLSSGPGHLQVQAAPVGDQDVWSFPLL